MRRFLQHGAIMANNWKINNEHADLNRFKAYGKKHPRETEACFTNLAKVFTALNELENLAQIKFGFFRAEGHGIWRIGQTGVPHAAETRLYVYLFFQGETIYPLTIGDKKQQSDDLRRCAEIVKTIKRNLQQ